jgi:hypothetical protein
MECCFCHHQGVLELTVLNCGHGFCDDCISEWFFRGDSLCPVCHQESLTVKLLYRGFPMTDALSVAAFIAERDDLYGEEEEEEEEVEEEEEEEDKDEDEEAKEAEANRAEDGPPPAVLETVFARAEKLRRTYVLSDTVIQGIISRAIDLVVRQGVQTVEGASCAVKEAAARMGELPS